MNTRLIGATTLVIASLLACTTPEETPETSATAPELTRFFFQPVRVQLGNTEQFTGTADFKDSDGNVASVVIQFVGPDGTEAQPITIAVAGAGQKSGKITIPPFDITPEASGTYTVRGWLMDADQ